MLIWNKQIDRSLRIPTKCTKNPIRSPCSILRELSETDCKCKIFSLLLVKYLSFPKSLSKL